jgi:hypothetical protein
MLMLDQVQMGEFLVAWPDILMMVREEREREREREVTHQSIIPALTINMKYIFLIVEYLPCSQSLIRNATVFISTTVSLSFSFFVCVAYRLSNENIEKKKKTKTTKYIYSHHVM